MAHDASHYAMTPQAVATPVDAVEVGRLFAAAAAQGLPLTFRSGGTSLSGQASTTGLLVDTRRHFRDIEVLEDGARVRVGPGATVRAVNTRLARYGRKLGPDPASEVACTLGGVVANNSSGMACGIAANTYTTLDSLVLVLPSGTVVDSSAPDADARLRADEPELHEGLARLRERVRTTPGSVRTIERLYAMKNTMGYGVNSFLDHTAPVDILAHLAVGSEGTLGFVASVVLRTVPLEPHAMTGLLVFDDLAGATGALPDIVATGPATVELLDAAALRVGQRDPGADASLRRIDVREHAALLVEYQAGTAEAVARRAEQARPALEGLGASGPAELTADPGARARLWHTRKGLYATVAGARPRGTTALLEDVVVPVPELLPTCERLIGLFAEHGYHDSVVFGHAKDGNLHFMLTEDLSAGHSARLDAFTEDMVSLVLHHGGSLKAEHGTGRMMAGYVERQYGPELYAVMREVKALCDPAGVLAPGVLIARPGAPEPAVKVPLAVDDEVDDCVECGYCEPVCPSRDLTTTPRQRIALRREMARLRRAGEEATLREVEADFAYDAVDTCAVDGLCATACPLHINTGDLMKRLRGEAAGPVLRHGWAAAARHWGAATRAASTALTTADALPPALPAAATRLLRRLADPDVVPEWSRDLPPGGHRRAGRTPAPTARPEAARSEVVLFTSCTGTMFGAAPPGPGAGAALRAVCERAGVRLVAPESGSGLCCGTPWRSKGMGEGARAMEERTSAALWEATRGGELDVVCDAASCSEGLRTTLARTPPPGGAGSVRVRDAVELAATDLLGALPPPRRVGRLVLHPTCSTTRLGVDEHLRRVAEAVAEEVVVPAAAGCCGFAGDRGLLHPELTASATRAEAAEVEGLTADAYVSANRTCELGMTRATGRDYRHVVELLEQTTRPRPGPHGGGTDQPPR
ncbi:FAD-binding oxidoreductase [Phycicoccus endophyticus]|uniref:D-lactate dehydrogenase (cytochrome) n=4 Tax=Phycicoccus endophyticus TaxID=1690220 RepID=A0A7G9R5K1_9MICO|nr:FAD-binding oxidoreductase [Phycicoccus endophyticus]